MPNNMPYDKWYWSDWFASTAILSIETKGVWHELLGRMFLADRTYYVEGTALELSRMVGCSEKQIINAVAELMRRNVADVTCNGEVTQCNDPVTDMLRIECRRYKKAYFERKSSAERVARFRRNRQCNGTVQTLSDLNQNQNHIYKEKSIINNTQKESDFDFFEDCPEPSAEIPKTVFSFEQFWEAYGKKVEKMKCEKIYSKISEADRAIIKSHVPEYVLNTPDVKYRKNPQTYLNGKCWHDEIVRLNHQSEEPWHGRTKQMEEKDIGGAGFL